MRYSRRFFVFRTVSKIAYLNILIMRYKGGVL